MTEVNREGKFSGELSFSRVLTREEIAQLADPANAILDGEWHHVAGKRFDGGVALWFDGEQDHVEIPDPVFRDASGNGNHGQIVGRPQLFEIDRSNPLSVGMTGG